MSKRVGDDNTSRREKASGETAYNLMEEGGEVIWSPEEKKVLKALKELEENTAANAMHTPVSHEAKGQKKTLYTLAEDEEPITVAKTGKRVRFEETGNSDKEIIGALAGLSQEEKTRIINIQDSDGRTLLHQAASAGESAIIDELIANKANLNAQDKSGDTALHIAAYNGEVAIVNKLIKAGANKQVKNEQVQTPIQMLESLKISPAANRDTSKDEELITALSAKKKEVTIEIPSSPKSVVNFTPPSSPREEYESFGSRGGSGGSISIGISDPDEDERRRAPRESLYAAPSSVRKSSEEEREFSGTIHLLKRVIDEKNCEFHPSPNNAKICGPGVVKETLNNAGYVYNIERKTGDKEDKIYTVKIPCGRDSSGNFLKECETLTFDVDGKLTDYKTELKGKSQLDQEWLKGKFQDLSVEKQAELSRDNAVLSSGASVINSSRTNPNRVGSPSDRSMEERDIESGLASHMRRTSNDSIQSALMKKQIVSVASRVDPPPPRISVSAPKKGTFRGSS